MKKSILTIIILELSCLFGLAQVTDTGDEVGIGISTPQKKFQVQDGLNMKLSLGTHTLSGGSNEPAVFISRWMGSGSNYQSSILHAFWNGTGHGLAFSLVPTHTNNVFTSYSTKMYLSQSGNLGVGLTTPEKKLQIQDGLNMKLSIGTHTLS